MRNLKDNEVEEYEVSGDHIQGVWMKPGWTHNIINLSETEDLVTVMWASEMLEKNKPDSVCSTTPFFSKKRSPEHLIHKALRRC
jgi:dTDP-4-dehydrorhamnose 3,5-epimerase-like enzyme